MSAPVLIGFESITDIGDAYSTSMLDAPTSFRVLLAVYECGGYDGESFVLLECDGDLYEVNGSHCSCHGLEGQFEPEQTTPEALRHRMKVGGLGHKGYLTGAAFGAELERALAAWEVGK